MWHLRAEIAPAILLVVDFGGWYRLDSKSSNGSSSDMIQHTQVSLLKDVIVPYTHLLPRLQLSENKKRSTLLYFKGAKHRHRVSIQLKNYYIVFFQASNIIWSFGLAFILTCRNFLFVLDEEPISVFAITCLSSCVILFTPYWMFLLHYLYLFQFPVFLIDVLKTKKKWNKLTYSNPIFHVSPLFNLSKIQVIKLCFGATYTEGPFFV